MAQRSLDIGVEYVKEREAFGQPIGAFQAVAPPAGRLRGCDRRRPSSRPRGGVGRGGRPVTVRRAGGHGLRASRTQTARDTSYRSLHFHGGYGFMLEYDIQLYYRRAPGMGAGCR